MKLTLKDLRPNPFRDFKVDPIDNVDDPSIGHVSAITKLKASIEEDGFWGGVVARKHNGVYQIAAGHHRIEAAIEAGIAQADIYVANLDGEAMVRIYARENATQRGTSSTAMAGSVAAALKFAAEQKFESWSGDFASSSHGGARRDDVGRPAILKLIGGVDGFTERSIQDHLAVLKDSGDYARIMGDVENEIEAKYQAEVRREEELRKEAEVLEKKRKASEAKRERDEIRRQKLDDQIKAAKKAERKQQLEEKRKTAEADAKRQAIEDRKQAEVAKRVEKERAKLKPAVAAVANAHKAAEKAAEKEITFDYEGVSVYLKNTSQIRAFRTWATGAGIKPYLPVVAQAGVAQALAQYAEQNNIELTASMIQREASTLLLRAKDAGKKQSKKAQAHLKKQSIEDNLRKEVDNFSRSCRGMVSAGTEIAALYKTWPKNTPLPNTEGLRTAIADAKTVIDRLHKEIM